jgi:micrococcal nuclease
MQVTAKSKTRKMVRFVIIGLLLMMGCGVVTEFEGKVVGVADGDTVTVLLQDNTSVKIRLEGIDCPEAKQDFGQKAKQATSELCYGKAVRVVKSGEDRYGRTLGFVFVDGVCVNEELLKMGMAWHYKKYNQDEKLAKLEEEARREKVGLWVMESAVAPWEFRKR